MEKLEIPDDVEISKESKDILRRMMCKVVSKRSTAKELLKHRLFDDVDSSVSLVHKSKGSKTQVSSTNKY